MYFILVRGQSEPGNDTPITILADVIPLSITKRLAGPGRRLALGDDDDQRGSSRPTRS